MKRSLGGGLIVAIVVVTALLWLVFRPAGQPSGRYLGEMIGTIAIVLFACSLVLATRLPYLEPLFGGLDRMYQWHRWTALAGEAGPSVQWCRKFGTKAHSPDNPALEGQQCVARGASPWKAGKQTN